MLARQIHNFNDNMNSLRDFVHDVDALITANSESHIQSALEDYPSPIDRRNALIGFVKVIETVLSIPSNPDVELPELGDDETGFSVEHNADHQAIIRFSDKEQEQQFLRAFRALGRPYEHKQLLYKSSLFALTAAVEWFVSDMLHVYLDQHPDIVETREKVFSYRDLQSFDSINDARKHILSSRIEEILRGSLDSWIEFFRQKLGLSMSYLDSDLPELREVMQRRNVLMHNGGIVNSIYFRNVDSKQREGIRLGDKLNIDVAYLDSAIEVFQRTFVLISAELWKKKIRVDDSRTDMLIKITFDHLLSGRWTIARALSYFGLKDSGAKEMDRCICQLNYWQAMERLGCYHEVRQEIEDSDYSGKHPFLQLGLYALTNDGDQFFSLLPSVLASGGISPKQLDEWPIFYRMREDRRYHEYVDRSQAEDELRPDTDEV